MLTCSTIRVPKSTHVKLSRSLINQLWIIHRISSKEKIEFAGAVDFKILDTKKQLSFETPTCVTSKSRSSVGWQQIQTVWPELIVYHTHPKIGKKPKNGITATLPSSEDFNAFIKLFPEMQANIICDAYGYYVIDLIDSSAEFKLPLPSAVDAAMYAFRHLDEIEQCAYSGESLEYFKTTPIKWKTNVNTLLNSQLNRQFGISIQYYSYDEEPAVVRIDTCQLNWKLGKNELKIV